jgi:hypothetical protein
MNDGVTNGGMTEGVRALSPSFAVRLCREAEFFVPLVPFVVK